MSLIRLTPETATRLGVPLRWLVEINPPQVSDLPQTEKLFVQCMTNKMWYGWWAAESLFDTKGYRFARPAEPHEIPAREEGERGVLEPLPLDCEVCKAPISEKAWPTCEKCDPAPTDAKDAAIAGLKEKIDELEVTLDDEEAAHADTLRQLGKAKAQLTALREAAVGFTSACEKMYRNPGKEDLWFDAPYREIKAALAQSTNTKGES
jgi:hypothetical protein